MPPPPTSSLPVQLTSYCSPDDQELRLSPPSNPKRIGYRHHKDHIPRHSVSRIFLPSDASYAHNHRWSQGKGVDSSKNSTGSQFRRSSGDSLDTILLDVFCFAAVRQRGILTSGRRELGSPSSCILPLTVWHVSDTPAASSSWICILRDIIVGFCRATNV